MSPLSKVKSEFLSIKVTRIKNPCKTCLVKSTCLIYKAALVRDCILSRHLDSSYLLDDDKACLNDIFNDPNLNLNKISDEVDKCNYLNFYYNKKTIRIIQKEILRGDFKDLDTLKILINEYKRLAESTKKIDMSTNTLAK
jgi:hypothetical protein